MGQVCANLPRNHGPLFTTCGTLRVLGCISHGLPAGRSPHNHIIVYTAFIDFLVNIVGICHSQPQATSRLGRV